MHSLVTGATGLLGGNLTIALLAAGQGAPSHTVSATRRGSSDARHLAAFPIRWVDADLSDPDALSRAFAGVEVVYHCAAQVSIQRRADARLMAANVDGTRNVLAAARRAGVRRVVHCSTVAAIGLTTTSEPSREEAAWNYDQHGMEDGYSITKHLAEGVVQEAVAAGQDVVIANPTYMFGPYDVRPSSGKMIVEVVKGRMPGSTPGINNFVDVRDVARGMIRVASAGRTGERYILSGEELSYQQIAARIAAIAGTRPPGWSVPQWLSAPLGWAGDLQEAITGREALINSVAIRYAYCTKFRFSSEKARRELGYTTGPLDTAIRDAIAWFRSNGMLPPAT